MAQSDYNPPVAEVMSPVREMAHWHEPLKSAIDRMMAAQADALPVVDGDELVGVVTLKEARSALERFESGGKIAVRDIKRTGVWHCYADTPLADALTTMREAEVRLLVVLDEDDRLAGMIDEAHAMRARAKRRGTVAQRTGQDLSGEEHPKLHVYDERPRLTRKT